MSEGKSEGISLCGSYTTEGAPGFAPKCLKGHRASIRCHEERTDCPGYSPSRTVGDAVKMDQYLKLVAERVADAEGKGDWKEVERLLTLCAETCLDKAIEVGRGAE